jgi:hypothetical protein
VIKGMTRYPIPVVLPARLAVDRSVTGRGLGGWLLRDAMLGTLAAAQAWSGYIRRIVYIWIDGEALG